MIYFVVVDICKKRCGYAQEVVRICKLLENDSATFGNDDATLEHAGAILEHEGAILQHAGATLMAWPLT